MLTKSGVYPNNHLCFHRISELEGSHKDRQVPWVHQKKNQKKNLPDQVSESIIQMHLELRHARCWDPCPGVPAPVPDHLLSEELFPDTQTESYVYKVKYPWMVGLQTTIWMSTKSSTHAGKRQTDSFISLLTDMFGATERWLMVESRNSTYGII